VRRPPESARHLTVLSGTTCPRALLQAHLSACARPGSLFDTHLRRRVPYILYSLHTVLAVEICINCAPYPPKTWPRLPPVTFCGLTPTARTRSAACSAALWQRPPLSLPSCVPRVGGRLWVVPDPQAPAVLPHRPHHPLGAARRGPGAAALAAHLFAVLL